MPSPEMSTQDTATLAPLDVSFELVARVARQEVPVAVAEGVSEQMRASAAAVAAFDSSEEAAYGVTTGFGSLASVAIPRERRPELQRALIRSHAAGMGAPIERECVRAMMLLRARSLAMGYSGARPVVVERIVELLNLGLTPVVPEYGSLGASGDLAPLAHCALAIIGEGDVVTRDGERMAAAEALALAHLEPLELGPKEGLALINGTDGMLGMLVLALIDIERLMKAADVAAAMSVEALLGTDRAFARDLMELRPNEGAARSAENLRRLLARSEVVASHRTGDDRVQDAYSLRCAPQVAGAAREAVRFAWATAEAELRSAIDNPLVLPDGRIESCGNFHGAPLAHACDFLAIGLADVGAIAERRTDRLLDASRSAGLPPFLAPDAGVNSGLMIAQYTQAALVNECQVLAHPAGAGSVPTSAGMEDFNSMGAWAALKARQIADCAAHVVAIELVCACQGVEFHRPLRTTTPLEAALAAVRERVARLEQDRSLSAEVIALAHALRSGELVLAG